MERNSIDHKNIYYPPGGILLWIIIFLELITFGAALLAMVHYGSLEPELFHQSKLQLNLVYGTVNTMVLLTSGFFMAISIYLFKQGKVKKSSTFLGLTMLMGLVFMVIKGLEYGHKIEAGLTMGANTFYTFYWLLTLFHLVHVVVGLVILAVIYRRLGQSSLEDFEAGATFWHMCDLIWLLVFPIVYLFF